MHGDDEEELARDLGIGARGSLPVPNSPRSYPLGWRAWPWRRISLMSLALLGAVAVIILGSVLM